MRDSVDTPVRPQARRLATLLLRRLRTGILLAACSVIAYRAVMLRPGEASVSPEQAEDELSCREQQLDDEQRLNTFAWIDRASGVIRLPIEAAKQKVIDEAPYIEEMRNSAEQ